MGYDCIWCRTTTETKSLEHILQSALGCRAARRNIACGPCNNSFTDTKNGAIDAVIADQFALVRNALFIWSGRNQPPPTLRDAGETDDGVPFDLAPGLVPLIRRTTRREKLGSDGKTIIEVITPVDKEKAAQHAEHIKRQHGTNVRLEKMAEQVVPAPRVLLEPTVGGRSALRAVGKSLMNLAGTALPREAILSGAFDELRDAVRHDKGPLHVGHDYVNAFPSSRKLGDFDHALHVVTDPKTHVVRGYATLFGHFRFSAVLAKDIALPPLTATLVQDPLARTSHRERRELVELEAFAPRGFTNLQTDFAVTAKEMGAAFTHVLDAATAAAPGRLATDLANELVERIAACTSDEEREAAISAFAAKAAATLTQTSFEELLDPSEFGF